jgi:hypothetical protein
MATIADLKSLLDAYGVGVRAGAITPQRDDEAYFRRIMDLPEMSTENEAYWQSVDGLKHPITLKSGLEEAEEDAQQEATEE